METRRKRWKDGIKGKILTFKRLGLRGVYDSHRVYPFNFQLISQRFSWFSTLKTILTISFLFLKRYPKTTSKKTRKMIKFKREIYVSCILNDSKGKIGFYTGCLNKHGNSVTNSISSLQIILWFSIVISTEKAITRKIFVC